MGTQWGEATLACDAKVCVHFGMKPVTLLDTMSPAMAFFMGSRVTPTLPVTVGPSAGNQSIRETNIAKSLLLSSAATLPGSTSTGFGGGTVSRMLLNVSQWCTNALHGGSPWRRRTHGPHQPHAPRPVNAVPPSRG